MGIVPVLLPLCLEPGHIDIRRTLRLASLARKTELHHLGQLRPDPGIAAAGETFWGLRQALPQHVGPGPGGVLLVARGHVARAHRAPHRRELATLANTGAFLSRPENPLRGRKIKHRLQWHHGMGLGRRQDAQGGVHRRGIDDLPRIENALRIEEPLHFREHLIAAFPHHAADKFAPQPAIAMLAAERAAIFFHQPRHVGRHRPKFSQALRRVEIKQRPQVQFPGAGMGVVDAFDPMLFGQQAVYIGDIGGEIFHSHRRVFDDLAGLAVARDVVDQSLSGPPQLPHLLCLGGTELRKGIAQPGSPHFASNLIERCGEQIWLGMPHLHHQHSPRLPHHERAVG